MATLYNAVTSEKTWKSLIQGILCYNTVQQMSLNFQSYSSTLQSGI